jgi:hypothetical protein
MTISLLLSQVYVQYAGQISLEETVDSTLIMTTNTVLRELDASFVLGDCCVCAATLD